MGYWSTHPMGGDAPSDVKYILDDFLFSSFKNNNKVEQNEKMYKKLLENKLNEASELDYIRGIKEPNELEKAKKKTEEFFKNFPDSDRLIESVNRSLCQDCSFILPFTVAELGIQIKDKKLSDKIKKMIGDGGAYERMYEIPSPDSLEYPKKENKWNNLESPFDYARMLYDLWDDLMEGKGAKWNH